MKNKLILFFSFIILAGIALPTLSNVGRTPEISTPSAKGKWSKQDRKRFMGMCIPEFEKATNKSTAKKICSCSLEKVEGAFPNFEKADEMQNLDYLTEIFKSCAEAYVN